MNSNTIHYRNVLRDLHSNLGSDINDILPYYLFVNAVEDPNGIDSNRVTSHFCKALEGEEAHVAVLAFNLISYILQYKTKKRDHRTFSLGIKNLSTWFQGFDHPQWNNILQDLKDKDFLLEDDINMLSQYPAAHQLPMVPDDDDDDASSLAPINRPRDTATGRQAFNNIIEPYYPDTPRESCTDRQAYKDLSNPPHSETRRELFTGRGDALNDIMNPETPRESSTDRAALAETTNIDDDFSKLLVTDFSKMTVPKLKEECKRRGLKRGGLKQNLLDRLHEWQKNQRANTPGHVSGTTDCKTPLPSSTKTDCGTPFRFSVKKGKKQLSYEGDTSTVMKVMKMDNGLEIKTKEMDNRHDIQTKEMDNEEDAKVRKYQQSENAKNRKHEQEERKYQQSENAKNREHEQSENAKNREHEKEVLDKQNEMLDKKIKLAELNRSVPQNMAQPPMRHSTTNNIVQCNHYGGRPAYFPYGQPYQQTHSRLGFEANQQPLLEPAKKAKPNYVKITELFTNDGEKAPSTKAFHYCKEIPNCAAGGKWLKKSKGFVVCSCNGLARLRFKETATKGKFDILYNKNDPYSCFHSGNKPVYPTGNNNHR